MRAVERECGAAAEGVLSDSKHLGRLRQAHRVEVQRLKAAHEARLEEATQCADEAESQYTELSRLYHSAESRCVSGNLR